VDDHEEDLRNYGNRLRADHSHGGNDRYHLHGSGFGLRTGRSLLKRLEATMQRLLTSLGLGFALFAGYQSSASTFGSSARPRR
jgi:hypothetical protein